MSERRAVVLVADRRIELGGLAASLVALVATTSLSPRTLKTLCILVAHETTIAAIEYGEIDLSLTTGDVRVYRRERLPRTPIGFPQEDSDVA